MAAFDFPPSPTPGTVANGYTWNGTAWTLTTGAGGDVTGPGSAVASHVAIFSGTSGKIIADGGKTIAELAGVFDNVLAGLGLANNATDATNDIDIAPGVAADNTNAATMRLASAMTKRLDAAWTAGHNGGGLDTGAVANATYHVWLIARSDTGAVDVLFSLSASAPTMPAAAYDRKRRIGSIVRTGGAIKPFIQDGDRFTWITPVADVSAVTNPGTAAVSRTLTVPIGIRVAAIISVSLNTTNLGSAGLVTDLAITDTAPSSQICNFFTAAVGASIANLSVSMMEVFTSVAGQVRTRISASNSSAILSIATHGYIDTRGIG